MQKEFVHGLKKSQQRPGQVTVKSGGYPSNYIHSHLKKT